jgi:hypothetical protein
MGPITICDPECEDFFLVTLQNEMVCEMVPESELTGVAALTPVRVLEKL